MQMEWMEEVVLTNDAALPRPPSRARAAAAARRTTHVAAMK